MSPCGRADYCCFQMTAQTIPRFLYAKSTDSVSQFRQPLQRFSDMPPATSVAELVPRLPPMLVVETLTAAFFADVNWRYGVPEEWFRITRSQMWMSLHNHGAVSAQVNAHWLTLLFAIMAIIGACSVTILPVGLELAMEITHNAGSSAILWFACVTDPVVLRASSC